jgi:predicted HNH restriction endonuclease
MYIFNNADIDPNTHQNRNHRELYPEPENPPAFFDLSDNQLRLPANRSWIDIKPGDIACVVTGTGRNGDPKRINFIYIVRKKENINGANIIRGDIVARPIDYRLSYYVILRRYSVTIKNNTLDRNYQFTRGFNVDNLDNQLDELEVQIINRDIKELLNVRDKTLSIGKLKKILNEMSQSESTTRNLEQESEANTYHNTLEQKEEAIILDEEDELAFPEGREKFQLHRSRERNGKLPIQAKQKRLREDKRLACDVCDLDFFQVYGDLGHGFIEAHHKIPISKLNNSSETSIEDLALVCSNCHRMLHRGKRLLTIEELREIVLRKKSS